MKKQAGKICLFIIFILIFGVSEVKAQLSFPKGNTIDTVIHVDLAYNETQIIFHTGKYKSSDYLYEKVSDSLHPEWLVTACFNGDCRNELEQSGRFISDFGLNDTTCFIAFHVESHDINGKSSIQYKVINSKDSTDQAILKVDVTYVSTTSYKLLSKEQISIKCYPNPASENIHIATEKPVKLDISIIDLAGKICFKEIFQHTNQVTINTSKLSKGVYFLQMKHGNNITTEKLIIQ